MTLEELESDLPNGFHDARLYGIEVDYMGGNAILHIAFDFGDPDGPIQEVYRIGELRITGLSFCSIDPPYPHSRYVPHGVALNVSGDTATPDTFPAIEELSKAFEAGVSCYRFFVHEWNSFINIAAKDVQFILD
jgi:hypothetical protein